MVVGAEAPERLADQRLIGTSLDERDLHHVVEVAVVDAAAVALHHLHGVALVRVEPVGKEGVALLERLALAPRLHPLHSEVGKVKAPGVVERLPPAAVAVLP